MSTPISEFHETVKVAVKKLQIDSGAFLESVVITWEKDEITSLNSRLGASSTYNKEPDDGE
jgi:hypothetical protein